MSPEASIQAFVRALLDGSVASRKGGVYQHPGGRSVPADAVRSLLSTGALSGDRHRCHANSETRAWLKRALLKGEEHGAQHRIMANGPEGPAINSAESPLGRLAVGSAGQAAFLQRHQVEAGERVRRLVERAGLQPRLTMSYSASRTAGNRPSSAVDLSDLAVDARRRVADIHRVLPEDCAAAVLDVCGWLKGLQEVERERGWPRRSAKLVLRIGLEQLAQHYGISPVAIGTPSRRPRTWLDEGARPMRFG